MIPRTPAMRIDDAGETEQAVRRPRPAPETSLVPWGIGIGRAQVDMEWSRAIARPFLGLIGGAGAGGSRLR